MRVWLAAVAGFIVLITAGLATAQVDVRDADADMFPPDVEYDPAIPTPEEFLGFKLGHEPVRHHQLVDYITQIAGMSDRLSVEVIGYTHERRPILFADNPNFRGYWYGTNKLFLNAVFFSKLFEEPNGN